MMDEFRRHPKVAGWLYTEHHDVINEWNGYLRADRSAKDTGLGELVPGMTLRDLHAPFYVAVGAYPPTAGEAGRDGGRAALGLVPRRRRPRRRAHAAAGARRLRRPRPERASGGGRAEGALRALDVAGARAGRRADAGPARAWRSCARASRTRRAACSTATSRPSWSARARRRATRRSPSDGARVRVLRADAAPPRGARRGACAAGTRWTAGSRTARAPASSSTACPGRRACGLEDVAGAAVPGRARGQGALRQGPGRRGRGGGRLHAGRGTHDPSLNPNAYPMTDGEVPERGARAW